MFRICFDWEQTTVLTFLETLMFIFFIFSIALTAWPVVNKKSSIVDDNAQRVVSFIIQGSHIILKRFYLFGILSIFLVISLGILINYANGFNGARALLALPAAMTSCIAGWISLHFSMKCLKHLLRNSSLSDARWRKIFKINSDFILTVLIAIILFDISIWVVGLDRIFTNNIFGLGEKLATHLGLSWSVNILHDINFLNMKNFFIANLLGGYAIGSTLHAVLARFNFSIFSTAFDTASDLIGSSKYDFPEDDLRNPAAVPDLIGDQLKNNYLVFSNLHATTMVIVVATSILGSLMGVIDGIENSITRVVFPICFMAFGLFLNALISTVLRLDAFDKWPAFFSKYSGVVFNALALLSGVGIVHRFNRIDGKVFIAIGIGLFSVIIIYPLIHWLLSLNSRGVKTVAKNSRDSILSTITSGLFFGFLGAGMICVLTCVLLGVGFKFSGNPANIFENLYLLGCIAMSLLVSSFYIISDTMAKPLIDNALGVSKMLKINPKYQGQLSRLQSEANIANTFFKVINVMAITLTASLFFFFFLVRSLRIAKVIVFLPTDTGPKVLVNGILLKSAQLKDFIIPFQIHFLNAKFMFGSMLGAGLLFGFIALVMWGVSVSYKKINYLMADELDEHPKIWE